MKHHTIPTRVIAFTGSTPGTGIGARVARFASDRFLLLPLGAMIALVWANTGAESYFIASRALRFAVNDVAMAAFFGLLAQEVFEEVMPGGALHTWRRWATPVVAAIGGTIVAPFVFLLYVGIRHEGVLTAAWPVACAIDMVSAYFVLKAVNARRGVIAFAMVMAIAADIIVLAIIAPRDAFSGLHPSGTLLIAAALGAAAMMRTRRVKAFWPYLAISGTLSWLGFYMNGLHPALSLIPIILFLPHEPRRLEDFPDTADDDPTHHVEHEWHQAVQVVLFCFGLVNAGVPLQGYDTGTWALLTAALIGRPVGMFMGLTLAAAGGLHLPPRVQWRDLLVVALATSSGFTLALFIAVGILAPGPVLGQIKIGALSIIVGALLAFAAAAALGVGRFAHRRSHPA